jgi:hypothetical protein
MRHFLALTDFTAAEIARVFVRAGELESAGRDPGVM